MTDQLANASARVHLDRDAVLGFLRSLVALQPQGEAAVQEAVAQSLAASGARLDLIRYEPSDVPMLNEFAADTNLVHGERESVVGTFAGRGGGRSLILFAHPDGEPITDTPAWQHDRFAGVIDNGRFHGWGIADDLAGVAAGVSAMAAIKAAGIQLAGDVIVASTPSKRHARGVAAVLHHGYTADAAIYLHPAESGVGMNEIKAFASGQIEFSITVNGQLPPTTEPGHTAFAHRAVNPFDKALLLIDALKALDRRRGERVRHPMIEAAIGRSTNILISSVQFGQTRAFSRLPVVCTVSGAVSFPPFESIEGVQKQIEAALEPAIAGDDWLAANRPALRWVSGTTGVEVADTHPLYRVVAASIEAVAGIVPHINPMHTASDIRNPWVQKRIPTVGFGPFCGDLTQTARHDEWVDAEDYLRAVEATAASIIGWCGLA